MSLEGTGALGDVKHCVVCGRGFGWRLRWADQWNTIVHCSPRCGRRRLTSADEALERELLSLVEQGQTPVSPNDAARRLGRGWRTLTERARDAARRLAAKGRIEFVQGDRVVDASSAKGPIRLRARTKTVG